RTQKVGCSGVFGAGSVMVSDDGDPPSKRTRRWATPPPLVRASMKMSLHGAMPPCNASVVDHWVPWKVPALAVPSWRPPPSRAVMVTVQLNAASPRTGNEAGTVAPSPGSKIESAGDAHWPGIPPPPLRVTVTRLYSTLLEMASSV